MENSEQLAIRFEELFLNGKWIANTNYKELLSDLNWEQAIKKIGSLNTIAALTYHVNYYVAGVLHFFEGGKLEISDKFSFDLPEIKSDKDWQKLLNDLLSNALKFTNRVKEFSDEELEDIFVDKKYGNYRRNIEGIIEHSYYHFGQISLIKKMVLESEIN